MNWAGKGKYDFAALGLVCSEVNIPPNGRAHHSMLLCELQHEQYVSRQLFSIYLMKTMAVNVGIKKKCH